MSIVGAVCVSKALLLRAPNKRHSHRGADAPCDPVLLFGALLQCFAAVEEHAAGWAHVVAPSPGSRGWWLLDQSPWTHVSNVT